MTASPVKTYNEMRWEIIDMNMTDAELRDALCIGWLNLDAISAEYRPALEMRLAILRELLNKRR